MTKTSGEIENEFIRDLKSSTNLDVNQWMAIIRTSGIQKRNDIVKWLKEDKRFSHVPASLLTGIYLNDGKPVYASEQNLLDNQFEKYPEMRPLFEELRKNILEWDNSVAFIAKKTYVSIAKKREFAALNIKKGELRLGMDLGEMPYGDMIEKSKLSGPMPRISHMVVLKNNSAINNNLIQLLETANNRVNS